MSTAPAHGAGGDPGTLRLAAFALLGTPLAFAALPIYLHVPRFYAEHAGLSLSLLGGLLLALRLLDALVDPFIGAWTDRVPRRPTIAVALVLLGFGFSGLFQPPPDAGLGWLAATLTLVTLGYSVATIAYQAWLADAAISEAARTRGVALREFFILLGIVAASVLPTLLAEHLGDGLRRMVGVIWPLIGVGALSALVWAPLPVVPREPVQVSMAAYQETGRSAFRSQSAAEERADGWARWRARIAGECGGGGRVT